MEISSKGLLRNNLGFKKNYEGIKGGEQFSSKTDGDKVG